MGGNAGDSLIPGVLPPSGLSSQSVVKCALGFPRGNRVCWVLATFSD